MTIFLSILFALYALGVAYVILGCMFTMLIPFAMWSVLTANDAEEKP